VEFELLGPLRVVEGDRDLTPARLKQRALLAMLLLHREEVVPGAQLIEALWGEEPPGTAQTALHGHVSALRKLIGTDRIRTRPPGYLLQVSADELDVARFESLVAQARERDDPDERSACLREALALWRGEPLADLRYEAFAERETARLEELRLASVEDRIDADLALGRHHELVAELEPLVAEHAFRERLRGQLMLALYRCGRQADALHVFQSGRRALVEGLGIDPGPALQQLQRRILNQDPSLDAEARSQVARRQQARAPVSPHRPAPAAERPELGEERKVATILFADVSGSTELGERLDPERLRALLRTFFEAMSGVIASWGGTLEKYIGDAIVAVFGVPTAHEDDPERAVRASLEMLERLEELNRTFEERHGITLAIRIGIDTGEVIAPIGGAGNQLVAGDTVNVAARLEQAAEPGAVLVGERTHMTTRRAFRFAQPLALEVKGESGAVIAHRVEGVLPASERRAAALQSPLIGRARELNQLNGLLDEAVETASPRLVLVYGPAGIGKSRLTREFLAAARERGEPAALTGRCPATGRGISYWALAEILRQAFGIALDDPAEAASDRLVTGARLALAGLGFPEDELARTAFALATTAGIALPDNPLDRLEPRLVADELTRAWPRFASALASKRPTIVVIEDLHWAGEPLVEMLERLVARSSGPLLLLATARPEFAQAQPGFAAGREGVTSISLQALSDSEGGALVDGLLRSGELPEELRGEIVRTAEGNPFFLEEIVLRLIDTEALVQDGERWQTGVDAPGIGLPDTVHGVLASRIDALPPGDKRVLQEAAVVGRVFWQEPLVRVLGAAPVGAALLRLEDRGFVVARPTSSLDGQEEYQFKHALVRDVAQSGLPKARRARAHAEHAVWLEELAADRRDELAELIAVHYQAALTGEDADLAWADDPTGWETARRRGFEALLEAGSVARHRFAISRALELHELARSLALGNPLEEGRALAALGDDHEAAYHGDEAFAAYGPALDVLRGVPGAEPQRARVCLMASRMAAVKWGGFRTKPTPTAMERFLEEGLELATDEETLNWLTVLKGNVGLRWVWSGRDDPLRIEERLENAQRGVELAESLDLPDLLSQAYRTHGLLQSAVGRWHETVDIARRDLRLADRLERTEQAFALFWNAIFLMEIAGEFQTNLHVAERALEVARGLTPHEVMHGTHTLMCARYHLGRWSELEPVAGEHLDALAKEPGIVCPYVRSGPLFAALALAHKGRLDRADELAATLTPDFDGPKLPEALLARYLVARGDPPGGRDLAERILGRAVYAEENAYEILAMLDALIALEDWDALTAFLPRARAFSDALALVGPASDRAEGLACAAAGDRAGAQQHLARALECFERMGVLFDAALTKERLATVASNGDAARLRHEAEAAYRQLEAVPHLERMRTALSAHAGRP
jgi:class 3 adenylate cyclase/DNA-binding winged helix-turn-helix (wHTH) protein/tetratricopeptide (TPR) repeat protein